MSFKYKILLLLLFLVSCTINNSYELKESNNTTKEEDVFEIDQDVKLPFKDGQKIIGDDGKEVVVRIFQLSNEYQGEVSPNDLQAEGITADEGILDNKNDKGIDINKSWTVVGRTYANQYQYTSYVSYADVYEFSYFRGPFRNWWGWILTAKKTYKRHRIIRRPFNIFSYYDSKYASVYKDNTYLYSRTTYYFHRNNGGWHWQTFNPKNIVNKYKEKRDYDKEGNVIKYNKWNQSGSSQSRYTVDNIKAVAIENSKSPFYKMGDTIKLNSTIYFCPKAAGSYISKNIKWSSSDSDIAEIDQNGNVIFKSGGDVVLKATTDNGKEDAFLVTVFDIETKSSLNTASINETISFTGTKNISSVSTSSYLWQYKKGSGSFISFDNGNSKNRNTLDSIKNFTSSGNYQVRLKYSLNGKNYYTKPMDITVWANYTNVINWNVTTNFHKRISDIVGIVPTERWGMYSFKDLKVNYHVYKDLINNRWRIKISSVQGEAKIDVLKGDGNYYRDVDTSRGFPDSERKAYYAVKSLKADYPDTLDRYTDYGIWYTYKATLAHEVHHHREYNTALHHYLKEVESKVESRTFLLSLFSDKNDLINKVLKRRGDMVSILNLLARGTYRTPDAYLYLKTVLYCDKIPHTPGQGIRKAFGAGQNKLNEYIRVIQKKAKEKGWSSVDQTPPVDIDVSNPCFLPY